jgi:O-antigen chain-terminating methyltransferase
MSLPTRVGDWLRALGSLGYTRARIDRQAQEIVALRESLSRAEAALPSLAVRADVDSLRAALGRVDRSIVSLATRAEFDALRASHDATVSGLDAQASRLEATAASVSATDARLGAAIDAARSALTAAADDRHQALQRSLDAQSGELARLADALERLAGRTDPPLPPLARAGSAEPSAWLYAAFEETFRGSRDEIAARLAVHLDDVRAASQAAGGKPVADVGCGRGEWIERLRDEGLAAFGVDSNAEVVAGCIARGLDVRQGDAIDVLGAQDPGSLSAVTAFHVVEHLPLAAQLGLMSAAHRALAPGGILVLETPNPENLLVGACTFYMDPTHVRPVPPTLLRFLLEASSFEALDVRRLHPDDAIVARAEREGWPAGLTEALGAPRDYAIVARRS